MSPVSVSSTGTELGSFYLMLPPLYLPLYAPR